MKIYTKTTLRMALETCLLAALLVTVYVAGRHDPLPVTPVQLDTWQKLTLMHSWMRTDPTLRSVWRGKYCTKDTHKWMDEI